MTSISITKVRAKFNQIVSEVNEFSQPITIINNRGKNAVLIGEEAWKAIQETLYLNSIPGISQSILSSKERRFLPPPDRDKPYGGPGSRDSLLRGR